MIGDPQKYAGAVLPELDLCRSAVVRVFVGQEYAVQRLVGRVDLTLQRQAQTGRQIVIRLSGADAQQQAHDASSSSSVSSGVCV